MPSLDKKNELLVRVYLVLLGFFIFAAAIGWRIIKISVIEGEDWRAKKEKRYMEWRPVKTQRGNIYAEDGESLLATSVEFFEIRMDPVAPSEGDFNRHIDGLSAALARFSGNRSAADWRARIKSARDAYRMKKKGGTRNLLIAQEVDHYGLMEIKKMPLFSMGQYKGGLIVRKKYVREKPYRDLASRTIGLERDQNSVGLEYSFDGILKGEEKKQYMKFLPPDLWISVYDPTDYEIIKGRDIVTTLDVQMQDIVHNELLRGLKEHEAEGATAVIMEVATGRIKAISNLSANRNGEIGEFENFAAAHRAEPGSTFKAASVLALLEDGFARSETIVDFSKGKKKFYDIWMYDSGNHGVARSTLKEALEKSSNVGVASIMHESYNTKQNRHLFIERLEQFGLCDKTGIEIAGEPEPFIKHPVKNAGEWYGTTIPWMSHGYELSVTPLQLLAFYNAIANDGKLMKPQLVKEIRKDGRVERVYQPVTKRNSIAKKENIKELRSMLEGVVEQGTAASLKSAEYTFAGKTGTTKVNYAQEDGNYNASFAGYWPADKPVYSMIVVVYGLRGHTYYGNQVAGPIFRRIMDWTYAVQSNRDLAAGEDAYKSGVYRGDIHGFSQDYRQIFGDVKVNSQLDGRWVKGKSDDHGYVESDKAKISTSVIPDLGGMGLRDAVYVLENLGMDVRIEGYGKVTKQSPRPGLPVKGQEVTLYLN